MMAFLLGLFVLLAGADAVRASWIVDQKKFHISAHGQTSCVECHDDIGEKGLHPDPGDINRKRTDFFRPDACLSCHDEVSDDLAQGRHGRKKRVDPAKYQYCIRCHKPHTQKRIGDDRIGKFVPGIPRSEQCGACHEKRAALPPPSDEDRACMKCHGLPDPASAAGVEKTAAFCFHCHARGDSPAQKMTGKHVPLMDPRQYAGTPHAGIACTRCHPSAVRFGHTDQKLGNCLSCHHPHDEKTAHDAHTGVACGACHLPGIQPVRLPGSGRIGWRRIRFSEKPGAVHQMVTDAGETSCRRCHFKGNRLGVPAMVLPAKGILCMPCHPATFSVGDAVTVIALAVFLLGIFGTLAWWFSGSVTPGKDEGIFLKFIRLKWAALRNIFSPRIWGILKALVLDVLLQRRLYRRSRARWFFHALIFYPFVIRFSWGMVALIGSLWSPPWPIAWAMLNKNGPVPAVIFDLTGLLMLAGLGLAFLRGKFTMRSRLPGLPEQDRLALGLIAAVVVAGFVLEGMRIAMTGRPSGSGYAFIGYLISLAFWKSTFWTGIYGYMWYVHAVLTGAFIAYIPFSRLFHVIMAPVVLAMNAVPGHGRGEKSTTIASRR